MAGLGVAVGAAVLAGGAHALLVRRPRRVLAPEPIPEGVGPGGSGWAVRCLRRIPGYRGSEVEAAARSVGLSRRRLRGRIGDGPSTAEQLPLTADLLASCLSAGAVPSQAAEAVARSVGGPMAGLLGAAAAELRLGADPGACWARFGRRHPALALLGRCLERAGASGVAPAEAVAALATEQRAAVARAALARSRRAGVIATAPLGLCFLPAFLLIGVAPVVIGLATRLLARI